MRRDLSRIGGGGKRVDKIMTEVTRLLEIAMTTDDEVLMRSAVRHALSIAEKTGLRVPRRYSLYICRGCRSVMRASTGVRVRTRVERGGKLVIRCGVCGRIKRVPIG
ncbi:MAG: hypothetical protein NZ920_01875 [Aigarchaeota archaeon]|nr:hypothetical protein [Aigarchaeota archaeon]MDW8093192.1 hypothetical protein [Nitrososphaerota archaeon]